MDPTAATAARRGRPQGARLRTSPPCRSSEGRSHLRPTSQHCHSPARPRRSAIAAPAQPRHSAVSLVQLLPPRAHPGELAAVPRGAPYRYAPHLQRNGGKKERRKGKGKGESERGGRYGIGLVTRWVDRKFGNLRLPVDPALGKAHRVTWTRITKSP